MEGYFKQKNHFCGNRKGHRTPLLQKFKLKRLLCFRESQWKELNKLLYEGFRKKNSGKKKLKRNRKKYHETIYPDIFLPYVPSEEPARNIWELFYDEDHKWGDLSRDEELRLKSILRGKDAF